jgi:hypothetical protein
MSFFLDEAHSHPTHTHTHTHNILGMTSDMNTDVLMSAVSAFKAAVASQQRVAEAQARAAASADRNLGNLLLALKATVTDGVAIRIQGLRESASQNAQRQRTRTELKTFKYCDITTQYMSLSFSNCTWGTEGDGSTQKQST